MPRYQSKTGTILSQFWHSSDRISSIHTAFFPHNFPKIYGYYVDSFEEFRNGVQPYCQRPDGTLLLPRRSTGGWRGDPVSSPPFTSTEKFWNAFNSGFRPLLDTEQLGTFILVLANASFDTSLQAELNEIIKQRYHALYQRFEQQLLSGEIPPESDEDLLVFFKIATVGLERIASSKTRTLSNWEIQFNPLRAFRPRRISSAISDAVSLPFCSESFHFNKPFMDKEIFWSGELEGRSVDLYYNKYPFTQGHGLLVPERGLENPQLLTESYHHYLCKVATTLDASLPGSGFGYNSYGAYASVNHLHFQMFLREAPFPIEQPQWRHHGGEHPYPATCFCTNRVAEAWQWIEQCHQNSTPYNVLYIGERCYLLPRLRQGSDHPPQWSSGFSWHEMAGGILTSSRTGFEEMTVAAIEALLEEVSG